MPHLIDTKHIRWPLVHLAIKAAQQVLESRQGFGEEQTCFPCKQCYKIYPALFTSPNSHSVGNMGSKTQADLKWELREMMAKRDQIEQKVEAASTFLNTPGAPGLTGSLLDKEVKTQKRHRSANAIAAINSCASLQPTCQSCGVYQITRISLPGVSSQRHRHCCNADGKAEAGLPDKRPQGMNHEVEHALCGLCSNNGGTHF